MTTKTYQGSCHCGAVRFECELDLAAGTSRCNCTFCHKARFWLAFAPGETFRLLAGADQLTDYQHAPSSTKTPFLHLLFCKVCGVRGFTRGGYLEMFGDAFHAINVACLDDAVDDLVRAPVRYVDGLHDDWSRAPAETRHL